MLQIATQSTAKGCLWLFFPPISGRLMELTNEEWYSMPNQAKVIGLGSNLGDRVSYLRLAIATIARQIGPLIDCSSIYLTAPYGGVPQPDFYNAVILVDSTLQPAKALTRALAIEAELGRKRTRQDGPRTIDIDLLVWGITRSSTLRLQLPHPRLHLRRFALTPLAELSPKLQPPGWSQNVAATLASCVDPLAVQRLHQYSRASLWWTTPEKR